MQNTQIFSGEASVRARLRQARRDCRRCWNQTTAYARFDSNTDQGLR